MVSPVYDVDLATIHEIGDKLAELAANMEEREWQQ